MSDPVCFGVDIGERERMELKYCTDVVWTDLPRIESPSTGLFWVTGNLLPVASSQYDIQEFTNVLYTPFGPRYGEGGSEQTRDLLLADIATGAVLVLQGLGHRAMLPLFQRASGADGVSDGWAIGDPTTLHPDIRHHAELALSAARSSVGRLSAPPRAESTPPPPRERRDTERPLASVTITHLYHDDEPVQGARFTAKLADGSVRDGQTDASGQATLTDIPPGRVRIRFEPDSRPYERVDQRSNPRLGQDIDSVINRHAAPATEGVDS